jgi:hypothetical protein
MAPNKRVMTTPSNPTNFVDKRRAGLLAQTNGFTKNVERSIAGFTCNATGTTTTAIGANAAPGTNDNNVARRGESFQIFNAAGAKKEETTFTVTAIAVAGSTTLTFTPAAATAPVSTDVLRWAGMADYEDIESMTSRLSALGRSDADINQMSINDMVYALRVADNADGV